MGRFFEICDGVMCLSWAAIYVFVVKSSIRHNYPAMSPYFTLIVLPWEAAALLGDIQAGSFGYAFVSHTLFVLGNTAIAATILFRLNYFKYRAHIYTYILVLAVLTAFNYHVIFRMEQGRFFTSFLYTALGTAAWIMFVCRPDYPADTENLWIAAMTVMADLIGCTIYFSMAGAILKILVVLVFVLHCIHFMVLWKRCV